MVRCNILLERLHAKTHSRLAAAVHEMLVHLPDDRKGLSLAPVNVDTVLTC